MPRSRYAKARDFEYKVRDDMAKHGWVTLRSPASRTPTDVYCIGTERHVFIQCKTNGVMGPREWNRFWVYCKSVDAVPVLAMRGARGKGIRYMLLTGPKDGRGRQPMVEWIPMEGGRHEVQGVKGERD